MYILLLSSHFKITRIHNYLFDFTFLQVNQHENNVQVMTFGQPRIGNAVFASLYSELVPNTIRVTHDHDIVPHLPPYYYYLPQKTYRHFPREVRLCIMKWWNLYFKTSYIIFKWWWLDICVYWKYRNSFCIPVFWQHNIFVCYHSALS